MAAIRWASRADAAVWLDNGWTNAGYEWEDAEQRERIINVVWRFYSARRAQDCVDDSVLTELVNRLVEG